MKRFYSDLVKIRAKSQLAISDPKRREKMEGEWEKLFGMIQKGEMVDGARWKTGREIGSVA